MKRIFFAVVTCLVLASALSGQGAGPSFVVESIEVRGARFASSRVVARETLLREGSSYDQADVDAALSRVNRLPFVLHADGSLKRGKDEGAYVLVISIVETMPVSLDAWSLTTDTDRADRYTADSARAGARWFFDSDTQVHVATDGEDLHEAGVTQYGLFGRPGYLALAVRWNDQDGTVQLRDQSRMTFENDPSPQVTLGLPLFGNHSIQGQWSRQASRFRAEVGEVVEELRQESEYAELSWVFDTTDGALPTRGALWRAGFTSDRLTEARGPGSIESRHVSHDSAGMSYVRYQPMREWISVLFGAGGALTSSNLRSRHDSDSDSGYGMYGQAGFTASLWPERFTRRFGDLRWENRATYGISRSAGFESHTLSVMTGIVQRGIWSTLRVSFVYHDSDFH